MFNGPVTLRHVGPVIECGFGWRGIVSHFMREMDAIHPLHGAVTFGSSAITGHIDITVHGMIPEDQQVIVDIVILLDQTEKLSKRFCESCGTTDDVSTIQQPHAMRMITRCQRCLHREHQR